MTNREAFMEVFRIKGEAQRILEQAHPMKQQIEAHLIFICQRGSDMRVSYPEIDSMLTERATRSTFPDSPTLVSVTFEDYDGDEETYTFPIEWMDMSREEINAARKAEADRVQEIANRRYLEANETREREELRKLLAKYPDEAAKV